MKNFPFIILIIAGLCFSVVLHAQDVDVPVHFAKGNFITGNNISRQNFKPADLQPSLFGSQYFLLLQFSGLPSLQTREELKNAAVQLGDYIPGNAYLAAMPAGFDFALASSYKIVSINIVPTDYKIDPGTLTYDNGTSKTGSKLLAITFNTAVNKTTAENELKKAGATIVHTKLDPANVIFINPISKNIINSIALLPFVNYISLQQLNATPINYNDISLHSFSSIQSPLGRNLRGKNITIGMGDNAEISTHIDFTGRLINRVYNVPQYHGTHTSGTTAGGGILNPIYQGMAPKSTIVSQWFNDIISNTPTYVTDNNLIATNNSYTTADNGCPGEGVYDITSNYIDAQMKSYDEVLHVFAAGNDGGISCSPYPASFATIKSGWQCAKNVITVGNLNGPVYTISGGSSRGPVQDGRIKPEIVASGTGTMSTTPFNTYGSNTGTSMAAPVITGASALLNERYHQLHGVNPKAALIKTLMCNTAEDLGNAGPDYTYGFGLLNIRKAVEAMEANQYIISAAPNTFPLTIPAGVRRLKVMLYWADAPASVGAASALVNDLDLTVSDNPVTTTHLPLILNSSPGGINVTAAEGADHKNNIEQVVIDSPAAGNYLMNVNAFSIPQGPQQYVLAYQMDMKGITVEYPFGGETLVPGQTETIRWTAYGDETKTFTVAYSTNNGGAWTNINTNVVDTARSLNWMVPATVSNDYLIRVSRNSSVYTDQSDYNFVVLDQPAVTASIPCEGFAQLDWAAIGNATSYDIMQLKGDSMEVIGNTTGISYLVEGLNANTIYWFGVRAKNGTSYGRRSVAVSALPITGFCTLAGFDNNFKAVSINAPVTGREFTSTALSASEIIKLTIKNLDNTASSGVYDLYYQVNGGAIFTETDNLIIPSLGSSTHSFTTAPFDFSTPGTYIIKAWVRRSFDTQLLDDTVTVTIKNLANAPVTLPLTDGFETTTVQEYTSNTPGLNGDDRADFKTNSTRGRGRTFVNTGFALNGTRAITLDQFPGGVLSTDSLLMTYNIATYNAGNQLRMEFNYKNHGQDNNPDNKVWIRGSDTSPWVYAYNLVSNQAALGQWKTGIINVTDVLDTVLPVQPITSSFQIKFGQEGNTSANVPHPIVDQDDGYTFDDVKLLEASNDIALHAVVSPVFNGCNAAGLQTVTLSIKNYSAVTFNNVPVNYRINGGSPVTDIVPVVLQNATTIFNFIVPANLTIDTDYTFDFWITEGSDSYRGNDSILSYSFHTSDLKTVTATLPYLEGFETDGGGWYTKGNNSSWQWGTPAKTIINKAPNGTKAWVTNLTGNYNDNEFSYLYSPCFDLSGLVQPVLSFSHIFNVETDYDFTWVEYSTDGGITWNKMGTIGAGTNWYDVASPPRWRISQNKWHVASTAIPTNSSNVRFRFVMSSDGGLDLEGVGIDDIHIFEKANIYTEADITTGIAQPVSGTNWIHFESGGKRIASVNPSGNDLGITNAYVYFNPSVSIRYSSNNQYYLNRNIVLKVSSQPSGNDVMVRFYFTDAEAKALMNATGCGICTTISDPYASGVTQYSETGGTNEDGNLANDVNGFFQFKLPANVAIIPYDTGYYAEFPVNSFSEFWINNGGTTANQPLPISLLSFEASRKDNTAYLQWITENEINTASFVIERSTNGTNYISIGTVAANNTGSANRYNFTDAHPAEGINYYRLRSVDKNNAFSYSPVRKVNFKIGGNDITIYPNPVTNATITISSAVNCNAAQLFDATGKLVQEFILQGKTNTLTLRNVAKGMYQLKIVTEQSVYTDKIMVQ